MDLRKLAVNMIPFPSLHFLITSFSPLQARGKHPSRTVTEHALIDQIFDRKNQMIAFDARQTKYLTATGIFRGKSLSMKIIHEILAREKFKESFLPWIPNNVCTLAKGDNHLSIFHSFEFSVKWPTVIFRRMDCHVP